MQQKSNYFSEQINRCLLLLTMNHTNIPIQMKWVVPIQKNADKNAQKKLKTGIRTRLFIECQLSITTRSSAG